MLFLHDIKITSQLCPNSIAHLPMRIPNHSLDSHRPAALVLDHSGVDHACYSSDESFDQVIMLLESEI
jgi:hypothetical protein